MKLCLGLAGLIGLGVLALVPACAGKSASEAGAHPSDGGGSSHEGGAASVAGAASAASGGSGATAGSAPISSTCPTERPVNGSACSYVGNQCNYAVGKCSSIGLICANGAWLEQPNNDGASLTCENYSADQLGIPKDGDSCDCRGELDCTFNECDATGRVHAVCDNTTWHVTSEPCTDAPCGPDGLRCKVGEACVVRAGGISASYQCVSDPCAAQSQTPSCACAGSLCHAPSERCVMSDGDGRFDCVCDTC